MRAPLRKQNSRSSFRTRGSQGSEQTPGVSGLRGLGEAGDGVVGGHKAEGKRKLGEVLRDQEPRNIQSLTLVGTAR